MWKRPHSIWVFNVSLSRDKNSRRNDISEIRSLTHLRTVSIDFNSKARYSIGTGGKEVEKSIRESAVCAVGKICDKGAADDPLHSLILLRRGIVTPTGFEKTLCAISLIPKSVILTIF